MMSRLCRITCLCAFTCFAVSAEHLVVKRGLHIEHARAFCKAVKDAQTLWFVEWVAGALCAKTAWGFAQVAVGSGAAAGGLLPVAAADSGNRATILSYSAALATVSAVTGLITAGLGYGGYRLFARSSDYHAARRVARKACPICLRAILQEPRTDVLSLNMIQAIEDVFDEHLPVGPCTYHCLPA